MEETNQSLRALLSQLHPVGDATGTLLASALSSSSDPLAALRSFQEANSLHPRFVPVSEAPLNLLSVLHVDRTAAHSYLLEALSDRFVRLVNSIELSEAASGPAPGEANNAESSRGGRGRRRATGPGDGGAVAGSRGAAPGPASGASASTGSRPNRKLADLLRLRKRQISAVQRRKQREEDEAKADVKKEATEATKTPLIISGPAADQAVPLSASQIAADEATTSEDDDDDDDDAAAVAAIAAAASRHVDAQRPLDSSASSSSDSDGEFKPKGERPRRRRKKLKRPLRSALAAAGDGAAAPRAKKIRRLKKGRSVAKNADTAETDSDSGEDAGEAGGGGGGGGANILRLPKPKQTNMVLKLDASTLEAKALVGDAAAAKDDGADGGAALAALLDSDDDQPGSEGPALPTSKGLSFAFAQSTPHSAAAAAAAAAATAAHQRVQSNRPDPPVLPRVNGKALLDRLLCLTFPYLAFPELQPAALAVLSRHPNIPPSYLNILATSPDLFSLTSMPVRRQIWQCNAGAFEAEMQPLLDEYIADAGGDPSELCAMAGDIVPLDPNPRDRRSLSMALGTIANNLDESVPLYNKLLTVLRNQFVQTHEPLYCALRHELLMLLHDRSVSTIYEVDGCHAFSWCLDACIADGHLSDRRLTDLKGILASLKRAPLLGDLGMVLRAPHTVHMLIRNAFAALVEVVENEGIPGQSDRLLFLCKLMALGCSARSCLEASAWVVPPLHSSFAESFLPLLASRILSDALRDLEPDAPVEPVDSDLSVWLNKSPVSRQLLLYYVLTRVRSCDLEGIPVLLTLLLNEMGPESLCPEHELARSLVSLVVASDPETAAALQPIVIDNFLLVVVRQNRGDQTFRWHLEFLRFMQLSADRLSLSDVATLLKKALIGGDTRDDDMVSAQLQPGRPLFSAEATAVFEPYHQFYGTIHPRLAAGGPEVLELFGVFIEFISSSIKQEDETEIQTYDN